MAANLKFCQVCYQKHISNLSTTYCSDCDQAFCSDCETFHSSVKSTSKHVTMSIEKFLSLDESLRSICDHCQNHDEKYQMYCQSHEIPLCLSCLEEHSQCKDVLTITKIIQNVNFSQFVTDMEEGLNDLEKNVSTIKKHLRKNKETLNTHKTAVLSEICRTRQNINEHLDKLEQSFREEITRQESTVNKQLDSVLASIETKTAKVLNQKDQVTTLKSHGINVYTFLALKRVSFNLNSSEKEIETMMENGSLDRQLLKCNINDNFSRLSSEIQTFGEIDIEKTPCDIKLNNSKERQAQNIITENNSVDDVNKKLIQSIDNEGEWISGCENTADGDLLLADYSEGKCLVWFDTQRKQLFDISIESNWPFDVTCIDEATVAVTTGHAKIINIVDFTNHTVKKRINVGYSCHGVTYRDGTLLTCAEGHGIVSVSLTDEKITTIVQCDLPPISYITTYKDKLYYTNYKTETVTCCDMEGNTIWTFKDKAAMSCPFGITTDNEGRVYVCESSKSAVVVLSNNGKQSKQLVSEDDGLKFPRAINFDKKRNNLLVGNNKEKLFLFHVTSL